MIVRAGDPPAAGALALPRLGYGGGSLFDIGAEREAADLLGYAYDRGFRYFDTAPFYGNGLAGCLPGRCAAARQFLLDQVGPRLRPRTDAARPGLNAVRSLRLQLGRSSRTTCSGWDPARDIAFLHDCTNLRGTARGEI
jgi:hypothetical protein